MNTKETYEVCKKRFIKPTPKKWKRLGNALVAVSAAGVPAMFLEHELIGGILFAAGLVGKFLTEFFTTED